MAASQPSYCGGPAGTQYRPPGERYCAAAARHAYRHAAPTRSWASSTSRPTRSRTAARSRTPGGDRARRRLAAEGAAILDVGGESTRPGRRPGRRRRGAATRRPGRRGPRRARAGAQSRSTRSKLDGRRGGDRRRRDLRQRRHRLPPRPGARRRSSPTAGCDCCLMHMHGEPRTMQARPALRRRRRRRQGVPRASACAFAVAAGRRARSASSSTRASASARRSSTTSSCCGACDELADARPPARDRHLAQVASSARMTGRDVDRARHGDGRDERDRVRARRARLPRPRRRRADALR